MDDVTKTENKTDKMLSRKDGNVGYVIFNNPERHNAVSLEMWARTAEILEEFARDDDVRVVVITGAGGKAFVSGADISKFESERASQDATKIYNATVAKANESIYEFAKPTIAMIRGYCIGGGMGDAGWWRPPRGRGRCERGGSRRKARVGAFRPGLGGVF